MTKDLQDLIALCPCFRNVKLDIVYQFELSVIKNYFKLNLKLDVIYPFKLSVIKNSNKLRSINTDLRCHNQCAVQTYRTLQHHRSDVTTCNMATSYWSILFTAKDVAGHQAFYNSWLRSNRIFVQLRFIRNEKSQTRNHVTL